MSHVASVGISVRCDDPNFQDLDPNLDACERLGVDSVELPTLAMDLIAGGRIMPERVRQVREILRGRPFRFTAHGPIGINLMDDPWRLQLHVDVLKASIEVAAEFGAVHYVLHTGQIAGDGQMPGIETAYARQREKLSQAGDLARECGVTLTVENVFNYHRSRHTALPSRLAHEIEAVDHPNVKACFDFSHGFINATLLGADFLQEAEALAPYAKHLHVHDSFGRPQDILTYSHAERLAFGQGDLHLPVGWGAVPWDDLMERCQFPPGVIFNIELEKRYWSEAEATVAATRRLAEHARSVNAQRR